MIEALYDSEDFWLIQKRLWLNYFLLKSILHLKEIFNSGELEEDSVIRKIRITAND